MLGICLDSVRRTVPLVHNITNYVTVNDVANILLACGGSPIMSDEPEDVEDITSICGGLNINIGTLNQRSIQAMFRAGEKAASLGHVLLLDPVGAGASALRTNTAVELMEKLPFTVIRGNISEIKTLALGSGKWHMIRTVVLPSSVDGIVTGCILAVGRIVGESAVLMFTAGMGMRLAKYGDTVGEFFTNLFDSSGATLTVALYNYAKERADFDSAFAVAVVLLVIAFVINIAAKLAGKKLKNR